MTDLLSPADTPTVKIVPIRTRPTPVVRAAHRRYGPDRSAPTSVRARRGGRRGRWTAVIVLAVMDITVAGFLLLTVLFPLSPVPDVPGSAPRSSVPSSVAVPPATVGGVPVAADVPRQERQGGGPDGGAVATAASTSTTGTTVVHDAASARGQTPAQRGPAGGPASTTTAVPSTVPSTPSSSVPDPSGPAPSTTTTAGTETTTTTVPDTTPTPPSTELLP